MTFSRSATVCRWSKNLNFRTKWCTWTFPGRCVATSTWVGVYKLLCDFLTAVCVYRTHYVRPFGHARGSKNLSAIVLHSQIIRKFPGIVPSAVPAWCIATRPSTCRSVVWVLLCVMHSVFMHNRCWGHCTVWHRMSDTSHQSPDWDKRLHTII
jgi:hypothetical protein